MTLAGVYAYVRTRIASGVHGELGQTMTGYGVAVFVVALAVLVAFTALYGGVSNTIDNVRGSVP